MVHDRNKRRNMTQLGAERRSCRHCLATKPTHAYTSRFYARGVGMRTITKIIKNFIGICLVGGVSEKTSNIAEANYTPTQWVTRKRVVLDPLRKYGL